MTKIIRILTLALIALCSCLVVVGQTKTSLPKTAAPGPINTALVTDANGEVTWGNTPNSIDNTVYVGCGTPAYTFSATVKTTRVCRDAAFGNTGKSITLPNSTTTIAGTAKTVTFSYNTPIISLVDVTVSSNSINSIPLGGAAFNATSVTISKDIVSVTFVNIDNRWEPTHITRAKLIAGSGIAIGSDNVISATGTSQNLGNADLNQSDPERNYTIPTGGKLTFKDGKVEANGGFIVNGNQPTDIRGSSVILGTFNTPGPVTIGGVAGTDLRIYDGVNPPPTAIGKYLKCIDSANRGVWSDLPTPPSGIAGVSASQGLTSQIISSMPDIQIGGNPTSSAITNLRGLNLGLNGGLKLDNIQLNSGSGQKRDAIVITNDNNAISGGDGDDIGIKFDIADNIARLSASDERFSFLTNKYSTIGTESPSGNGVITTTAGSITLHQNNSSSNSDLILSGNNLTANAYATPRNDAGAPLRVAAFNNFGVMQVHDVGELPFQAPISAGTGINIVGNTISAFDASPTNEIQTLSTAGSNISISGGNTITIPSPAVSIVGSNLTVGTTTIDIQQPPNLVYKYMSYFDDFFGLKENLTSGNIGQLDWKITTTGTGTVSNSEGSQIGLLALKTGTGANGSSAELELPSFTHIPGDKIRFRVYAQSGWQTNLANTIVSFGWKSSTQGLNWGLYERATAGANTISTEYMTPITGGGIGLTANNHSSLFLGAKSFWDIEMRINAANAELWVDNAIIGSYAAGSLNAQPLKPFIRIEKIGTTTTSTMLEVDYFNQIPTNPIVR